MAASDHLHPHQLRMFMTANEILDTHQPLDLDREGYDGSQHTTRSSGGGDYPTARTWGEHHTRNTTGGSRLYMRGSHPETDDELWDRKADEARYYIDTDEGINKPVSLGYQIGESGKPQVVGGHHRIAAMAENAPDTLMPVLHYRSFDEARQQGYEAKMGRGGFKYS